MLPTISSSLWPICWHLTLYYRSWVYFLQWNVTINSLILLPFDYLELHILYVFEDTNFYLIWPKLNIYFSVIPSSDKKTAAAITIQAAWRGWLVRHEISQQSKIWLSAITIQAAWRGYCVRKWYRAVIEKKRSIAQIDPELVEKLHKAATTIQVNLFVVPQRILWDNKA